MFRPIWYCRNGWYDHILSISTMVISYFVHSLNEIRSSTVWLTNITMENHHAINGLNYISNMSLSWKCKIPAKQIAIWRLPKIVDPQNHGMIWGTSILRKPHLSIATLLSCFIKPIINTLLTAYLIIVIINIHET